MSTPQLIDDAVWKRIARDERTMRVLGLVRRRFNEPIGVAEAARVAGLDEVAFARLFRRTTGLAFSDFLTRCRVLVAHAQLQRRGALPSEVAKATGFGCLETFDRAFARLLGVPSAYCGPIWRGSDLAPETHALG